MAQSSPYVLHNWASVRKSVVACNPELATLIDKLSPGCRYPLLQVRYPYARYLFTQGQWLVMDDHGDSQPLHQCSSHLQRSFQYAPLPLGLVLNHGIECFATPHQKVIPIRLYRSGELFGFDTILQQLNCHSQLPIHITAGARCVYTLAPLKERHRHQRLMRHYALSLLPTKNIHDQWHLFRALTHHIPDMNAWHCDVLWFSQPWTQSLQNDRAWLPLFQYCQRQYNAHQLSITQHQALQHWWHQWQNQPPQDQLNQVARDTLDYLITAALGKKMCLASTGTDQTLLPATAIQQMLVQDYQIPFLPSLWQPGYLSLNTENSQSHHTGYYPLRQPLLINSLPIPDHTATIALFRSIKQLLERLQQESLHTLPIDLPWVTTILQQLNIAFTREQSTHELMAQDRRLAQTHRTLSQKLYPLAHSGTLLQSSLRLTIKTD